MITKINTNKVNTLGSIDEEFDKFEENRKLLRNYQNWRGAEKAAKKRKKNRR